MKPLELNAYPKDDGGDYRHPEFGYKIWPDDLEVFADQKRLLNSELAAEYESARCDYLLQVQAGNYWAPLGDTWSSEPDDVLNRAMTLLRFATLPHYDEKETP